MEMRKKIYGMLDNFFMDFFKRAGYYRYLGKNYQDYIHFHLSPLFSKLPPKNSNYIQNELKRYINYAYLSVTGQTSLINLDICGIDIKHRKKESFESAFANGLVWLGIKLIDNQIDENQWSKNEVDDFLEESLECVRTGRKSRFNGIKGLAIDSSRLIVHSGYAGNPLGYSKNLEELCSTEKNIKLGLVGSISLALDIGKTSAKLGIAITKQFIPEYPCGFGDFLIEQGITGRFFDDFKDFNLDRKDKEGYEKLKRGEILFQTGYHFWKHFLCLNSSEAKKRNLNFIVLASLFHGREFVGEKEKS